MISKVSIEFDLVLDVVFRSKPTVLRFLKGHERKPVVLRKLCEQLEICEHQTYSISFDAKKYRYVIKELALYWATMVLKYAEEQALSHAERSRRLTEAGRLEEAQGWMEEMEAEALATAVTSRPGGVAN